MHGSLARAGKVRGQTPKVAKQDKKKKPRGRAHKRMQYNRRFVTAGIASFIPFITNICASGYQIPNELISPIFGANRIDLTNDLYVIL